MHFTLFGKRVVMDFPFLNCSFRDQYSSMNDEIVSLPTMKKLTPARSLLTPLESIMSLFRPSGAPENGKANGVERCLILEREDEAQGIVNGAGDHCEVGKAVPTQSES